MIYQNKGDTSLSVWPDVGVKSSPIFPKVAQKVANAVFTQEWCFSK